MKEVIQVLKRCGPLGIDDLVAKVRLIKGHGDATEYQIRGALIKIKFDYAMPLKITFKDGQPLFSIGKA